MNKTEAAMRQALEALKVVWNEHPAITALTAALKQPTTGIKQVIELYDSPEQPAQQEPVAWLSWNDKDGFGYWDTKAEAELNCSDDTEADPLYTRPKAREWVGLTDEQLPAMWTDAVRKAALPPNKSALIHYKEAIEAKLREKNNG